MPRGRVKKTDDPVSPAPTTAPTKSRAKQKSEAKESTDHHLSIFEWIHQHTIEAISLIPYHRTVLARMTQTPIYELPNVLFHGAVGFPLEYMAYALVSGADTNTVPKKRECLWENKVPYCDGDTFFEVQCRHPDLSKDYGVLCEFLHSILPTRPFHQQKNIFILRDIDVIAKTEHHYALRVLLERYSNNVLFIATTHVLSAIETPLRSRFMMVRVPQPSIQEGTMILNHFGASVAGCASVGNDTSVASERKTLMELLYTVRSPPPEDPKHMQQFLSQSPSPSVYDIRFYAYRCFQKGMPFAYFCMLLIRYAQTVKHRTRLVQELTQLEYILSQSSKGREPIYYEKALYITLFANSIWK